MKKIIYLLVLVLSLVSLAGCVMDEEKEINLDNVVFESIEVQYDGLKHSIYATNLPQGVVANYKGNNVTEVGVHTVTAELFDTEKNLLGELTATITISLVFNDATYVYDGLQKSIFVENLPEGYTVAYAGNKVIEAGEHTVTAKIYNSEYENVLTLVAKITIVEKTNVELPLV